MDTGNLVKMANQIGDFFQSMPDRQVAKQDIAQHLKNFWEPRMREALITYIDDASTSDLHEIVRESVKENLALLATQRVAPRK